RKLEMAALRQHVRSDRHDDVAHRSARARPRPHHLIAIVALIAAVSVVSAKEPTLTVSGKSLLVDGQPAFLLGVSLFGALDVATPPDRDLDTLKTWGVRIVRVWAHWHVPIYQADGDLSPAGRGRLLQLAEHVGARGMILELVLLRPGQLP